jgi:glutamate formiminotransferase
VLECVANVSEGRDRAVLRAIAEACGPTLVDVHADPDHHRAVFTLAGSRADDVVDATRRLGDAVAARVSIVDHIGVHPFIGALDVVPFVALGDDPGAGAAVTAARDFGAWWAETHALPVATSRGFAAKRSPHGPPTSVPRHHIRHWGRPRSVPASPSSRSTSGSHHPT